MGVLSSYVPINTRLFYLGSPAEAHSRATRSERAGCGRKRGPVQDDTRCTQYVTDFARRGTTGISGCHAVPLHASLTRDDLPCLPGEGFLYAGGRCDRESWLPRSPRLPACQTPAGSNCGRCTRHGPDRPGRPRARAIPGRRPQRSAGPGPLRRCRGFGPRGQAERRRHRPQPGRIGQRVPLPARRFLVPESERDTKPRTGTAMACKTGWPFARDCGRGLEELVVEVPSHAGRRQAGAPLSLSAPTPITGPRNIKKLCAHRGEMTARAAADTRRLPTLTTVLEVSARCALPARGTSRLVP